MKTYVINLARRKDRLHAMASQLSALGIMFERIPAIDSVAVEDNWLARYFTRSGPLGEVPKGDKCCSLSHRRAWAAFLASHEPYAVVLEDDVALDPAARPLLTRADWLPENAQLVKLEHFGPSHQRVLVGETSMVGPRHEIAPILSRHTGAGAYILSREAAGALLTGTGRWDVPVDHLLFNPNVSPIATRLKPLQLLPAIARQQDRIGGSSDIVLSRHTMRKSSLAYLKREIIRAYYELRLLPRQIAKLLRGEARLVKVAAESFENWGSGGFSDQTSVARLLNRV